MVQKKHILKVADFVNKMVDTIVGRDTPVNISGDELNPDEVERLREYVPIFRVQVLLLMMEASSQTEAQVLARSSLVLEAVSSSVKKHGLTQEQAVAYGEEIIDMHIAYQTRVMQTEQNPQDQLFCACMVFAEKVFPSFKPTSEHRITALSVAKQIYRNMENIMNSVILT
ncbi:MAG: hypothetical protein ACM3UZ_13945 [Acidobacteriota bacterium]